MPTKAAQTSTIPAVKERPILFNSEMVNAILSGQKTQTRRIIKQNLAFVSNNKPFVVTGHGKGPMGIQTEITSELKCPFGKLGDRLYVRETWLKSPKGGYFYRASISDIGEVNRKHALKDAKQDWAKWKPSIHMPQEASRILLEIINIRVEKLQSVSEADAKAEGIIPEEDTKALFDEPYKMAFIFLWQEIYGLDSVIANPWVWVVEFKVLEVKK